MTKEQALLSDINDLRGKRGKAAKSALRIKHKALNVLRCNKMFHPARYNMLEFQRCEILDIHSGKKLPCGIPFSDKHSRREEIEYALTNLSYRLEEIDWELCILWEPEQEDIFNE